MKRHVIVLLCLMVILMFGACGPTDKPAVSTEPDGTTEPATNTELPNPMAEIQGLDFKDQLSFNVIGWPNAYPSSHNFAIAGALAEINFTTDKNAAAFRVAPDTEGEISGVYDAFDATETADISGIEAAISYTAGQTGLATWSKDGYNFSLYMKSGASADTLKSISQTIIDAVSIVSTK
jgi:hypothetical protein